MSVWLDIVGVPEAGVAALGPDLRALVARADIVIGVQRRLAGLDGKPAQRHIVWDGKLEVMVEKIMAARGTPTVLLASGDPNWFGIGATLSRRLAKDEFAMHPAPSSFQLAAARLHWPMQNAVTLSLHGRPVEALHPHVLPGNRILALTGDAKTLADTAALLTARGYGASRLTVLENLGGNEQISTTTADAAETLAIGNFFVLAIDCVGSGKAALLPPVPGLPDDAFETDGQLTKREIRAATLARLAPYPGALLWDVGAGSGSIGIEWMRAAPGARAICFERSLARGALITRNRTALGVPGLELVVGDAPESLVDQPAPDALFLGGGVGDQALFAACWKALKPGGRLVANGVTLDAEAALFARQAEFGGELVRIGVEVLDRVGAERVLRPRLGVTQWACVKEGT